MHPKQSGLHILRWNQYLCRNKNVRLRYFIELSYRGTHYHGWQLQPDAVTVQEKVNEALSQITGESVTTVGAGRTDTGVHASQMVVHIDTSTRLNLNDAAHRFNAVLPEDIVVHDIKKVQDDAHARFHATSRTYEYRMYLGRNPFLLDTSWQLHQTPLNLDKMNEAANLLLNHRDFKCFSKSKTAVKTYLCSIEKAHWVLRGKHLTFHITADRFLRNMVRAIVGTLISVGKGKTSLTAFEKILESQDRRNAGTSAPAKGLFLTQITYPESLYHV